MIPSNSIKKIDIYIYLSILATVQSFYFLKPASDLLEHKIVYSLCTFIFYLLVTSISKKCLNVFIILSFIISCFIFSSVQIYGPIDYSYIAAIFYTDINEATSYMKFLDSSIYIPLLMLLVYSFFLILNPSIQPDRIQLKKRTVILLLIILMLPGIRFALKQDKLSLHHRYVNISPISKILKIFIYYQKTKKENEYISREVKKPDTWQLITKPEKTKFQNIVVVVGESVRKDFLDAYGFPIKNTPFISHSTRIQFNNYIATYRQTIGSLTRTLALSSNLINYELNNNIVTLAKRAGYETNWISNQGMVARHDSPVTVIANKAEHTKFLHKQSENLGLYQDIQMLPYLQKILKNKIRPQLIVLHQYGSHPSACDRTQGKYDEYLGTKEISCYNKSIKNLDIFLQETYQQLRNTGKTFAMIYVSDHGLKITNKHLSHGIGIKQAHDVPLLLWNSDIKNTQEIDSIRTGKDFLHFFSEVLGVKTTNINKSYQFISQEKNNDKVIQVLNSNNRDSAAEGYYNVLDYHKLKDNPLSNTLQNREK